MNAGNRAEVILIHGLWYGSWTLFRLGRALRDQGYSTRNFNYAATSADLMQHATDLRAFALQSNAPVQHLVGHSLGGLIILKMLSLSDEFPAGRNLLLGTPLKGSITARKGRAIPGVKHLLGEVRGVLEQGYSTLPAGRETGLIAGSRGIGLGLLTGGVNGPGDGTIGVEETYVAELNAHSVLPVTHSGMLYSGKVIQLMLEFLETGVFDAMKDQPVP